MQRERKAVPRFRRKNVNNVDIDDQEDRRAIEEDLRSVFTWTSDATSTLVDNRSLDTTEKEHVISLVDEQREDWRVDHLGEDQRTWNIHFHSDENNSSSQWIDNNNEQRKETKLSLVDDCNVVHHWSIDDEHRRFTSGDDHLQSMKSQHDLITDDERPLLIDHSNLNSSTQMCYSLSSVDFNLFPVETDDPLNLTHLDTSNDSFVPLLSLPQSLIPSVYLRGISVYNLSLSVDDLKDDYSPLSSMNVHLDAEHCSIIRWSLEILHRVRRSSVCWTLKQDKDEPFRGEHSWSLIKGQFNWKSIEEEMNEHIYSVFDEDDNNIDRWTKISSLDESERRIYSLVDRDRDEMRRNFGEDECRDRFGDEIRLLEQLKTLNWNLPIDDLFNQLYSPRIENEHLEISFEKRFLFVDELSRRAWRRYRCKHLTFNKNNNEQNTDQFDLDSTTNSTLVFKGNESIAIGEQHYHTDLQQEHEQTINPCPDLLVDLPQSFDLIVEVNDGDRGGPSGPCLRRSDYECEPPETWSSLRREIGSISFDSSFAQPEYRFDKSFKTYIHLPKERQKCSFNVFQGYQQFIEKVKEDGQNYFRPFNSLDLRPLLHWYHNKQTLFSSTNPQLLSPPTFICRRLVLRTILANLYCDSDPWKLLVVRMKGQYYLALANRGSKDTEEMSEDEYSGYRFESMFASDQPNSTRLKEKIPLEHPQRQFHTVQYWKFGKYSLLYSNEIDGEIAPDLHPRDETTVLSPSHLDDDDEEIEVEEENDDEKQKQINANLQLTVEVEVDPVTVIVNEEKEKKTSSVDNRSGRYIEMKCTKKKIFYRAENQLKCLSWWAQMWLAKIDTLMIGYKCSSSESEGLVERIDLLSVRELIGKFLSRYDLRLHYCLSYLYSFLQLIERTVLIDDPHTIHAFAYIPQPLQMDPLTGETVSMDLPSFVPFRYTEISRSQRRHDKFIPDWFIQRTDSNSNSNQSTTTKDKSVDQLLKKRVGHRGRSSCPLKQQRDRDRDREEKKRCLFVRKD